jgi:hypothetical protein
VVRGSHGVVDMTNVDCCVLSCTVVEVEVLNVDVWVMAIKVEQY